MAATSNIILHAPIVLIALDRPGNQAGEIQRIVKVVKGPYFVTHCVLFGVDDETQDAEGNIGKPNRNIRVWQVWPSSTRLGHATPKAPQSPRGERRRAANPPIAPHSPSRRLISQMTLSAVPGFARSRLPNGFRVRQTFTGKSGFTQTAFSRALAQPNCR